MDGGENDNGDYDSSMYSAEYQNHPPDKKSVNLPHSRTIERAIASIRTCRAATNSLIAKRKRNLISDILLDEEKDEDSDLSLEWCINCIDFHDIRSNSVDTVKHRIFDCTHYHQDRLLLYPKLMEMFSLDELNPKEFDYRNEALVVKTFFCWELFIQHNIYILDPGLRSQLQDKFFSMDDSFKPKLRNILVDFLKSSDLLGFLVRHRPYENTANELNHFWLHEDNYRHFQKMEYQFD